ncbi:MAG TPA: response regulator [Polyangiales bacterium]|nr:response regulator [Polyangiales bacterium]
MDRSELIRRLLAIFLVELEDHLQAFNQELVTLEQRPPGHNVAESINTLFRAVHSMKGAARSVDALRLANACHNLETLLSPMREGDVELTPELFTLLFEAADVLTAVSKEMQAGATDGSAQVIAPLDRSLASFGHAVAGSPPPAAMPPLAAFAAPEVASPAPAPADPAALSGVAPPPARETVPAKLSLRPPPPAAGASAVAASPQSTASGAPASSGRSPARSFVLTGTESRSAEAQLVADAPPDEHASVRVPVRRLDALLWRSGELSIARRRFEARRDELAALHESVTHLRGRLRGHGNRQRKDGAARMAGAQTEVAKQGPLEDAKSQRLWQTTFDALERIENELARLSTALSDDVRGLERAAAPLEAEVHNARLLAFGESCEGLQRAVRDLAKSSGKEIELVIEGATLELDRAIIEGARSALLQLVRNAVDHGIESPAERIMHGKAPRSSLAIRAAVRGDRVEVSVSDDGRGIDLDALRSQAARRGIEPPEDERELVSLIFRPGFSTARVVSDVSGRGVGLDVVCAQVESLRGELEVEFEPGRGTTFRMRLPLTASSLRGLLVQVSEQLFAIPNSHVQALVRVGQDGIAKSEGREIMLAPTGPIPLCSLRDALALGAADAPDPRDGNADEKLSVVVLAADGRSVALSVDRWLTEQELVLKPLGRRVRRLRHVSAAAVLPTGQVSLVLKPHELVRSAFSLRPRRALGQAFAPTQAGKAKRVLLADDSVTTRTLEKSILETAGYEVIAAPDGEQAFKLLLERGADIVVSDVEMPKMDGFMLTEAIRGNARFRDLPVVLLTALESDEARARGLASGASAYLVKTAFDQDNLLKTLKQLA